MFLEYPYINFNDLNLGWVVRIVKEVKEITDSLNSWRTEHEKDYLELKKLYDDIMAGRFPESMTTALNDWMRRNAISIVGEMVKNVFFGLTDTGYFVAYIPESWKDIVFKTTGYDFETVLMREYGHLVLQY